MPGAPRPNEKCTKIAYQILKVPKDKQQDNQRVISQKKKQEWLRDSSMCQ
jgi:hypothetical protein